MPIPETIPEKYLFFACVDSVEVDETETSESVASIDIYMAPIFVDYTDEKGVKRQRIEGDKLVPHIEVDLKQQRSKQMNKCGMVLKFSMHGHMQNVINQTLLTT